MIDRRGDQLGKVLVCFHAVTIQHRGRATRSIAHDTHGHRLGQNKAQTGFEGSQEALHVKFWLQRLWHKNKLAQFGCVRAGGVRMWDGGTASMFADVTRYLELRAALASTEATPAGPAVRHLSQEARRLESKIIITLPAALFTQASNDYPSACDTAAPTREWKDYWQYVCPETETAPTH